MLEVCLLDSRLFVRIGESSLSVHGARMRNVKRLRERNKKFTETMDALQEHRR